MKFLNGYTDLKNNGLLDDIITDIEMRYAILLQSHNKLETIVKRLEEKTEQKLCSIENKMEKKLQDLELTNIWQHKHNLMLQTQIDALYEIIPGLNTLSYA